MIQKPQGFKKVREPSCRGFLRSGKAKRRQPSEAEAVRSIAPCSAPKKAGGASSQKPAVTLTWKAVGAIATDTAEAERGRQVLRSSVLLFEAKAKQQAVACRCTTARGLKIGTNSSVRVLT